MTLAEQWKRIMGAVCAGLLLTAAMAPAQAALIGTNDLLTEARVQAHRAEVLQLLQREDVRAKLEAMGVDPEMAAQRVKRMTGAELARLHGRLSEVPAGGDALGVALFIFLALVVTDLVGLTDLFPFIDDVN